MASAKLPALLVLAVLVLSSSPLALAWEKAEPECNSCQSGSPPSGGGVPLPSVPLPSVPLPSVPLPSVPLPPVGIPSVPLPSVPIPKLPVPPVTVPSVPIPKLPVPPVTVPSVPIPKLPVPLPPVTVPPVLPPIVGLPPVTLPPIPVIGGSPPKKGHRKACPPPPSPTPTPTPTPSSDKCPIDALKLGACVDILGNEVHIGDANVKCCPLVKGIAGLSAAACLCTAIKAKVLDISVYVPIALEVLLNCGCAVPPGYKCT